MSATQSSLKRGRYAQLVLLAVGQLPEVDAQELGADGGRQVRYLRRRRQQALLLGIRIECAIGHRELLQGLPLDVREERLPHMHHRSEHWTKRRDHERHHQGCSSKRRGRVARMRTSEVEQQSVRDPYLILRKLVVSVIAVVFDSRRVEWVEELLGHLLERTSRGVVLDLLVCRYGGHC